jgi:hypothetical protein
MIGRNVGRRGAVSGSPRPGLSRSELRRTLGVASVVAATLAGLLYLLVPGPAYFIFLVMLGPVAVWLAHPPSDGTSFLTGAAASGGAALSLLVFKLVTSVLALLTALALAGVTLPEETEPSTFDLAAVVVRDAMTAWAAGTPSVVDFIAVIVGSAIGGGATALIARILSDMIPAPR